MTGQEFRAWRTRHGLTQAQCGALLGGLSVQRISRLETGAVRVQPEHVLLCWLLDHPAISKAVAQHQGLTLPHPL